MRHTERPHRRGSTQSAHGPTEGDGGPAASAVGPAVRAAVAKAPQTERGRETEREDQRHRERQRLREGCPVQRGKGGAGTVGGVSRVGWTLYRLLECLPPASSSSAAAALASVHNSTDHAKALGVALLALAIFRVVWRKHYLAINEWLGVKHAGRSAVCGSSRTEDVRQNVPLFNDPTAIPPVR